MSQTPHSQQDEFTLSGHWWLPSAAHKVAGDLQYTEESLTLSLYGGLNDAVIESPFAAVPDHTELPIIHGETLDDRPVTLLNSFYTNWTPDIQLRAGNPGERTQLRESRLNCARLIDGIHLTSEIDTFSRCQPDLFTSPEFLGFGLAWNLLANPPARCARTSPLPAPLAEPNCSQVSRQ